MKSESQIFFLNRLEAAEHGDADAQLAVSYSYSTGIDIPQDDALAMFWYRKSGDLKRHSGFGRALNLAIPKPK